MNALEAFLAHCADCEDCTNTLLDDNGYPGICAKGLPLWLDLTHEERCEASEEVGA